jgi:hypothetical protein
LGGRGDSTLLYSWDTERAGLELLGEVLEERALAQVPERERAPVVARVLALAAGKD